MPFCVVVTPKLKAAGSNPLLMLETLLPLSVPWHASPPPTVGVVESSHSE